MFEIPDAGLHLRALRAATDLDNLLSLENHADIAVWSTSSSPIPKGATWKDMAHKGLELQTEMACIIKTLPSATGGGPNGDQPTPAAFVGVAMLWIGPDRGHRHARYTITLAPQYWGKGYATKVTQLMVEYAFSNLNLHWISLEVRDGNKTAIRVYEKWWVTFLHVIDGQRLFDVATLAVDSFMKAGSTKQSDKMVNGETCLLWGSCQTTQSKRRRNN